MVNTLDIEFYMVISVEIVAKMIPYLNSSGW